jgi:hypothetical protein
VLTTRIALRARRGALPAARCVRCARLLYMKLNLLGSDSALRHVPGACEGSSSGGVLQR